MWYLVYSVRCSVVPINSSLSTINNARLWQHPYITTQSIQSLSWRYNWVRLCRRTNERSGYSWCVAVLLTVPLSIFFPKSAAFEQIGAPDARCIYPTSHIKQRLYASFYKGPWLFLGPDTCCSDAVSVSFLSHSRHILVLICGSDPRPLPSFCSPFY